MSFYLTSIREDVFRVVCMLYDSGCSRADTERILEDYRICKMIIHYKRCEWEVEVKKIIQEEIEKVYVEYEKYRKKGE